MYGVTTFTHRFIRDLADEISAADGTDPTKESRAWAAEQSLKDINRHDDTIESAARGLTECGEKLSRDLGEVQGYLSGPSHSQLQDLTGAILGRQQAWTMLSLILDADQLVRVREEAARNRAPKA